MKVKCINNTGNWLLTRGEVYEVVEGSETPDWILIYICGEKIICSKKRFKIMEE